LNLGVFLKNITSKYSCFEYDNEVVKLITRKIIAIEDRLMDFGVEISCDREITWICFKIRDQHMKHI
jgi:hypothetical protein